MGGGVALHSSLTGPFFSAATGTGRRLGRSFAATVGRNFVVSLVRGWAVLCKYIKGEGLFIVITCIRRRGEGFYLETE